MRPTLGSAHVSGRQTAADAGFHPRSAGLDDRSLAARAPYPSLGAEADKLIEGFIERLKLLTPFERRGEGPVEPCPAPYLCSVHYLAAPIDTTSPITVGAVQ
jgi:hypothetical protein